MSGRYLGDVLKGGIIYEFIQNAVVPFFLLLLYYTTVKVAVELY